MSGFAEMLQRLSDLAPADRDHLQMLVADWHMLADLSFADLVLYVPRRGDDAGAAGFVAVAQVRPSTGPTSLPDDVVGTEVERGERPLLDAAYDENRICREGDPVWHEDVPVREETIPISGSAGRPIAVVARHTNLAAARAPSRLELAYLTSADELAQMVCEGSFPFPGAPVLPDANVRVGDGLMRLDGSGNVSYASPNALSAYRRLGLTSDLVGEHLATVTAGFADRRDPVDESVVTTLSGRAPNVGEVAAAGAAVRFRAIPLLLSGERIGVLVLVRDVTDLRHRDRQLLSKDATIREIHHRVKNNLQTVAALLRLQARRLRSEDGRLALEEAVRRVGSIALVHETLALTLDSAVAFDEIADSVLTMVSDVAGDAGARVERRGTFGMLPAAVATPLAMVLTELVQNAIEHGLGGGPGYVEVSAARCDGRLDVTVADDGRGLPAGFVLEDSTRLGLQIVRTLVGGELDGSLELRGREGGGTKAVLAIPLVAESTTP
ncbi:MAG: sensor histidine kinase [Actinomycetes bacterium]